MELLTSITFGQLVFILFSVGILTIAIFFAWDQCTRLDDQENYYEDEINRLKAKIVELELERTRMAQVSDTVATWADRL
tara:strand:+ start:698 stop:934 length:237 start_codon:yes stop_codon:yes gene_type:complete